MICPVHKVEMKHYSNAKGEWDSHKLNDGTWCNGGIRKPQTQSGIQSEALVNLGKRMDKMAEFLKEINAKVDELIDNTRFVRDRTQS